MKKVILALLMVLTSNLSITTIFGAARVGVLRIPDRALAEQYNRLPWYGCLCCMERINQQFMADVALTRDLIESLKMTSPVSLRELFLKSQIETYPLSEAVERQLHALGFLDEDNQVKITWRQVVLYSLLKIPRGRGAEFTRAHQALIKAAAVEDLARKHPEIIPQLGGNLNEIPRPTYTTLAVHYNLIDNETEITAAEAADILAENARLDHSDFFSTVLTPKSLDDLFFDLGMIVFIENE